MYKILNIDNMTFETDQKFDIIFNDFVYENLDFCWAKKYFQYLKPNSIFIAMTDFHSQHRYRTYMEDEVGAIFVNHLVWRNEWGNYPKNKFHQVQDDIIIYSNGKNWEFYPEKIQVPKATGKSKGLNPSGRNTKPATTWIDDIVLTTVANERIKKNDGKLICWQKPLRLYDRIILPFVGDKKVSIFDPFMGSGSLGEWSVKNGHDYIGIENDGEVFELAKERIENCV